MQMDFMNYVYNAGCLAGIIVLLLLVVLLVVDFVLNIVYTAIRISRESEELKHVKKN